MKKRALSTLALVAGLCFTAQAASSSWSVDADGNWVDTANWTGGVVPGLVGLTSANTDVAYLTNAITLNRTVTVDLNRNIGGVAFGSTSTNAFTLSGNTLVFGSGGTIIQTLESTGQHNDTIAANIQLRGTGNRNYTIRNDSAGNTAGLVVNGDIGNAVSASGTYTIYLDGVSTAVGIGAGTRNNTIAGVIKGASNGGKIAVVKNGTGLWTLTGNNTFNGGFTLNAGTLRYFGAGSQIFGTGAVTINDGVTFQKGNDSVPVINNAMTVNGNFRFFGNSTGNEWSGSMNLAAGTRIITNDADLTISGVISNGGLTKAGTSTLTLSGVNTYTGATTVAAGKLLVEGSLASEVTVQNGGTLGGTGTLQKVTLNAGAILAAGNSPGTMTFDGDVLMATGSTNIMEITDIAHDILMGNGANTLTMDGATVFDFTGFTGGVTNGYTIALSDMFSNWSSVVTTGATYSAIGLTGGQSLNFTGSNLTVIPEPATVGMLGLGALLTIMLRRIRIRTR
ncbi:MAG: autotransporter-associated beta strand repeat-containing protein [Kiritimatiellales bacterium]|jgi:autotransporter-associated beta strand protein